MMSSSLKRFRRGLVALVIISLAGVAGYRLAGWSLLDSIYMVSMVFSTVGLGSPYELSPELKIFTTLLMIFGVSAVFYIVGGLLQMMFEGEINRAVGMRRAGREIKQLHGHVVICGFGRMGEILARELQRQKKQFVILEKDPDRVAEAAALKYLLIDDNATEEDALLSAGITRAKTLVTTLPGDADSVFITLTARNLNPDIKIIARGEFPSTEKKLIQAGADRVVLPAAAGAMRMAAMITRPSAVELIEVVAGRQISEVEVDELIIPPDSPLVGMSIRESQPRARHGLLIVATRLPGGTLEFNPGGDAVFQSGASVVVMGRVDDIDRFRAEYKI